LFLGIFVGEEKLMEHVHAKGKQADELTYHHLMSISHYKNQGKSMILINTFIASYKEKRLVVRETMQKLISFQD